MCNKKSVNRFYCVVLTTKNHQRSAGGKRTTTQQAHKISFILQKTWESTDLVTVRWCVVTHTLIYEQKYVFV